MIREKNCFDKTLRLIIRIFQSTKFSNINHTEIDHFFLRSLNFNAVHTIGGML